MRYSVFILWSYFRQFSCIYSCLIKSCEHLQIYQVVFNIFNFLWKGLNIKLQQFVTIFCWNIYHQTCRCLFCLFTFWEEKKCNPVFNPWLSLLFNPWSSQGIYLHHSNPIVLKIPCAKFHASSRCQTKVKVEGQFCPLPLPSHLLPTHIPKKEVQKAHLQ